jgi:hypothetical protein
MAMNIPTKKFMARWPDGMPYGIPRELLNALSKNQHYKEEKMERKELLTLVLIGVLLVTVAVQTVQLVTLSGRPVVTAGSTGGMAKTMPMASGGGMPASLEDLPSMVGGC